MFSRRQLDNREKCIYNRAQKKDKNQNRLRKNINTTNPHRISQENIVIKVYFPSPHLQAKKQERGVLIYFALVAFSVEDKPLVCIMNYDETLLRLRPAVSLFRLNITREEKSKRIFRLNFGEEMRKGA